MSTRPYVQKTSAELEALYQSSKADEATLKRLAKELRHRRVPTARVLAKKVDEALKSLSSGTRGEPQPTLAEEPKQETKAPEERVIACKGCDSKLRVRLLAGTHRMNCPTCKSEFTASFADGIFSVEFEVKPRPNGKECDRLTLEDAYQVFDASPNSPWELIEKARRKLIQQYHPDKVAALGPKLREVAEIEGKRINRAFDLVRAARGLQ